MLVYLSKRVNIPNQSKLHCIAWNRDQGWIACGGSDGMLKVLKLDGNSAGAGQASNLSMNQTLEGHTGAVVCAVWNPIYRKLTTSDETGLIIVWILHRSMWYEEMVNNRNKSFVTDMKWTSDGKKICIVYDDGAVIVGSVDGNRLWSKELNVALNLIDWAPNNKVLLFVNGGGRDIMAVQADGVILGSIALPGQRADGKSTRESNIVAIHWYDGIIGIPETPGSPSKASTTKQAVSSTSSIYPNLCIAFDNGTIQLSLGYESLENAIVVDTGMKIIGCKWNYDGSVLAVSGSTRGSPADPGKPTFMIKFYDRSGRFLRFLKIPGSSFPSFSWEQNGLRLALAVDGSIFFANVRPAYTWAAGNSTIVYCYQKTDRRDTSIVFWDTISSERYVKYLGGGGDSGVGLKFVRAIGDHYFLVVAEKVQVVESDSSNPLTVSSLADSKKSSSSASGAKGNKFDEDDDDLEDSRDAKVTSGAAGKLSMSASKPTSAFRYSIQLRNSIGVILDIRRIPFVPTTFSVGPMHVIASNDRTIYSWQYQTPQDRRLGSTSVAIGAVGEGYEGGGIAIGALAAAGRGGQAKERMFDIETAGLSPAQSPENFTVSTDTCDDPITCTAVSERYVTVGRRSGTISRYTLPHLTPENVYKFGSEISRMEFNCTSSRLGLIDISGNFSILDLDARNSTGNEEVFYDEDHGSDVKRSSDERLSGSAGTAAPTVYGKKLTVERKDVWDMCWSSENPESVAVMEKTKLVVINHETAEDTNIVANGCLARYSDYEVRTVSLDDILATPEDPRREHIVTHETKMLRDMRERITVGGLVAGQTYASKNSHPRIWRLLAESALEELDFATAEKAYVRRDDYYGIQLVKQLRSMPDKMKARAEVSIHLKRFDEAESIYREIDRKDLAIQLRKKVGEYPRVVSLLQSGGGNDELAREAWDRIGDYYADKLKWKKALQYYSQSKNQEQLVECYYRLEKFPELQKLKVDVTDGTELLATLAVMFESVGLCADAVECHLRCGNPKAAVDCCVHLNQWDKALELAEQHDFPQVEGLLTRYAQTLIQQNRKLDVVELYRRANKPNEASQWIAEIADEAAKKDVKPALAKKLHVLSALEVERHRQRATAKSDLATLTMGGAGALAEATAATLDTLMMTSLDTQMGTAGGTAGTMAGASNKRGKQFANAWRGAAAYHFYMLAQRQFYNGHMEAAMKTCIKLCEYDDIIDAKDIYCLLALSSLHCSFFGVCSKAFVKLETLDSLPEKDRDEIETLAVKVFIKHAPTDPAALPDPYLKCLDLGKSFKACVITGRAIHDSPSYMCKTCRHSMLDHERSKILNCPLCHSPLPKEEKSFPL